MKNTAKAIFPIRYETHWDIKDWVGNQMIAMGLSDDCSRENDRTLERGDIIVSIEFVLDE